VEKHVGTLVSLSKQLGISVSTLNTIIKNSNINVEMHQYGPMVKKQKYIKKSRFEEVEDILKMLDHQSPSKWHHPLEEGNAYCQKITN
jgi:hypothetical protein